MTSQFYEFKRVDGGQGDLKSLNLAALTRGVDVAQTTVSAAFAYVPWFRRACKLRANAIGRFPLRLENAAGEDVSELPEYQPIMLWTRGLLYRTEMNLVKYGAAYHILESNRFGLNVTPRFIPSPCVYPVVDWNNAGVTGFTVSFYGSSGTYPTDKVIWVWEPNDESEIQPGPGDGEAALKAAGILYAISEMVNRYMGSGGVPVTAVRVPPTTDPAEKTKIENWFQRFAGGFRNAFKFLAVDKQTEFETIGSELKDMEADRLTASQRDDVAVAIGVPPTVLDGKSANYATANSEMTGFFMNTVIPEAEFLEPILNTQLYQRLGLTLRFNPSELEVMQAMQLEQAKTLQGLTAGKQIMSVNEARDVIELEEAPGGDWPAPDVTPAPQFSAPPAATPAPDMPMAEADDMAEMPDDMQMRAWLQASLASHRAGKSATAGTPFDGELSAASSGNMIRSIYTSHWPRKANAGAPDIQLRLVTALEEYNALARAGENGNG